MKKNRYLTFNVLMVFVLMFSLLSALVTNAAADHTAPLISNVTSSTTNGTYGIDTIIPIQIVFNEAVNITGSPLLALNTGANAVYASGSGTTTITFNYTVGAGQSIADLNYVATTSLNLNGGSIADLSANALATGLPLQTGAGSLGTNKNIVINTTQPTITSVTSSASDSTYGINSVIPISVTFSSNVNVTGSPQLSLNSGGTATYSSGSGTNTLTFSYTVQANNSSSDLNYTDINSLTLNGGSVRDGYGNPSIFTLPALASGSSLGGSKNIIINAIQPKVTSVSTTSLDGTYKLGDTFSIQINFDKNINVTGNPILSLNTGGTATYSSGSGSSALTFTYTIQNGDYSKNLNYTSTTSLLLNGGTIADSLNNPANVTLPDISSSNALNYGKNIVIETSNASITKVISDDNSGNYVTGNTLSIKVCFNQDVYVNGTPSISLNSGGTATYSSGNGTDTLTFNYTVQSGNTINGLNYSSVNALSLNGGSVRNVTGRDSTLILPSLTSSLSLFGNKYFTINITQPVIINVTSTYPDGHYGQFARIPVQIVFSKAVTVTGTPQLTLNNGKVLNYTSGSGTNTLTFNYDVLSADTQTLLNYSATTSLSLNGGTIKDASSNNAILTLPSLTSSFSLTGNKAIRIDARFTRTILNIGGTMNDAGYSIANTNDGGYIAAGYSASTTLDFAGLSKGGGDAYVRKYTSTNTLQWAKNYGGTLLDNARCILQTTDGGYIFVGSTQSSDGDFAGISKGGGDSYVIKTTSDGTISWKKVYGGTLSDLIECLIQTSDGGYLLGITETSTDGDFAGLNKGGADVALIKLDGSGNTQWKKMYGGTLNDYLYKIVDDKNGGYLISGYSSSYDGDFAGYNHSTANTSDAFLIRLDTNGNKIWTRNFGGTGTESFYGLTMTSDGNILAVGHSNSSDGDLVGLARGGYDGTVVKYDINGNKLWQKIYGGTGTDVFYSVLETLDGNYILHTIVSSTDLDFSARTGQGGQDFVELKITPDGTILWYNSLGSVSDDQYQSHNGIELSNGIYIGTGMDAAVSGDFISTGKGGQDAVVTKTAETITDFTAPSIPIINLSNRGWSSGNVNFTVTNGTDSGVGILKSQYRLDGGSWTDYSSQVTVSTNGWHVIEAKTIDNNNNISSITTTTFGIDASSDVPTISASPNSQPTWTNSLSIVLTYNDSLSGTGRRYYKWDIDSTIEDDSWTSFNDTNLQAPQGEHYLQTKCIDNAGNTTTQTFGPYKFDNVLPEATLSPDGYGWVTANPSVSLSYSDSVSGINGVYYKIDSDNIIEDSGWTTYSGSISDNIQGTSYIQVKVVDNAGNVTLKSSNPCKYDSVAPTLTVTNPNLNWETNPINISITSNDVASGIASLQYKYDVDDTIEDNSWIDYSEALVDSIEGIRYIHVKAVDNAGNTIIQSYGPYKYDGSAPSITVNPSSSDWSKTSIGISVLSNDATSGTSSILYKFDTDNIIDDNTWTPYSGSLIDNIEGTRYLNIKSIDNAGNTSMQCFGPYSFDDTIPLKPVIDYDTNNKVVTISNIQDSVSSPIAYYTINNGAPIEYTTPFMVDYSCTIDAYTLDSAGNKSDIATYSITIDGQIFTVSLDKNEISFSSVTPSNSEYEVKNALKSTIASSSAYKIELKTIDNFKSASNNSVSSDNLSFKLSTDGTYNSMQNNINVLLASSEASPSGKDFYLDSKLHTEWNDIPDTYNTQIEFIVTIIP